MAGLSLEPPKAKNFNAKSLDDNWKKFHVCIMIRVAIRPVFAGTVPFLGLGPGVPPSLSLCPGIFDSKFAFVNTVCQQYTNEPFFILY